MITLYCCRQWLTVSNSAVTDDSILLLQTMVNSNSTVTDDSILLLQTMVNSQQ